MLSASVNSVPLPDVEPFRSVVVPLPRAMSVMVKLLPLPLVVTATLPE